MTVTHSPTGQDLVCLVCHKQAQDIDHVVNRGMGGSKARDVPENKVPLCRECHELKTLGRIKTWIGKSDTRYPEYGYLIFCWQKEGADYTSRIPVEVSRRYKCVVGRLSDGAEEDTGEASPVLTEPSASSLKEGSDEPNSEAVASDGGGDKRVRGDSHIDNPVRLTHDQRVAIAAKIKDTEWNRQWVAGDTANAWRAELGEEAEQYISDFGYVQESIANIMYACEQIPPAFRNAALRFSHHLVVLGLNREDMEMWLDKCVEEGWSVAEFRKQVKGTKVKERHACPDCGAEHNVKE